jgi:OOP family OmpA-OmpF porin
MHGARLAVALLLAGCSAAPPAPVVEVAAPVPAILKEEPPQPAPPPPADPPAPIRWHLELYALQTGAAFETDSAVPRPGGMEVLDGTAWVLRNDPGITVQIGCHTDHFGSADHKMELSQRRAEAVRSYLASRGVAPERMTAVGYGMTRPLGHAPAARQRRCVLVRTDE